MPGRIHIPEVLPPIGGGSPRPARRENGFLRGVKFAAAAIVGTAVIAAAFVFGAFVLLIGLGFFSIVFAWGWLRSKLGLSRGGSRARWQSETVVMRSSPDNPNRLEVYVKRSGSGGESEERRWIESEGQG